MSLQFSTTWRNAALDLFDTIFGSYQLMRVYTGSPPINCAADNSGILLIEFDLQSPSWNPAFDGSKSLANITFSSTAIGTDTPGHFRLYDGAAGICHLQGTITASGGGGDMTYDNVTSIGQSDNVTQFTILMPGA